MHFSRRALQCHSFPFSKIEGYFPEMRPAGDLLHEHRLEPIIFWALDVPRAITLSRLDWRI